MNQKNETLHGALTGLFDACELLRSGIEYLSDTENPPEHQLTSRVLTAAALHRIEVAVSAFDEVVPHPADAEPPIRREIGRLIDALPPAEAADEPRRSHDPERNVLQGIELATCRLDSLGATLLAGINGLEGPDQEDDIRPLWLCLRETEGIKEQLDKLTSAMVKARSRGKSWDLD